MAGLAYGCARPSKEVRAAAESHHEISGSSEVAAMPVEPVVKLALDKLGKKPVAIPGWHNRLLVYTLKLTPRRLQSLLAGRVMAKLVR